LSYEGAWDFVKAHPELEIVTIHPALVLGPVTLGQSLSTVSAVADILKGTYKESGYPPRLTGVVDVRDVSLAHILALDHPAASNQRYILALPVSILAIPFTHIT
jgi:dihydroflavonol-4-reductase